MPSASVPTSVIPLSWMMLSKEVETVILTTQEMYELEILYGKMELGKREDSIVILNSVIPVVCCIGPL